MAGPPGVGSRRGSLDETKTSYAAQNSDSREPAGGDNLRSSWRLMTLGEPIVITVTANSARIGSVVCSRLTKPGKSHEPMTGYMPCPALKARHQRTRTSPQPSG